MRVLFVFSLYPAEPFAIVEVDALRSRGIDVVPLSLRGGRHWLTQDHPNRDREHGHVAVVPLSDPRTWLALLRFIVHHPRQALHELSAVLRENMRYPRHLVRSLYVCLKAPAVTDIVRREGIDAVHIFWGHYPALIIPFVKCATPNVAVTAFLGAYTLVKRIPSGPRVLAGADVLTTHFDGHVSQIRDGWLRRRLPIALIYRGVDLEPLRSFRVSAFGMQSLVIVSRLAPNKTVEDGIRTFALVHEKHPEFHLDVIGDGPCRSSLEHLVRELGVADRVTFHGLLPQRRAFAIVARATALIMPSLSPFDFYPNAVKEAMALGVPCAAYAIAGIAGFDDTGRAVRLAKPGSVDDLARATNELIENPDLARATAAAAMIRVRDFDIRTTSAHQAELFRALTEHAPLPSWVLQSAET